MQETVEIWLNCLLTWMSLSAPHLGFCIAPWHVDWLIVSLIHSFIHSLSDWVEFIESINVPWGNAETRRWCRQEHCGRRWRGQTVHPIFPRPLYTCVILYTYLLYFTWVVHCSYISTGVNITWVWVDVSTRVIRVATPLSATLAIKFYRWCWWAYCAG